MSTLRTTSAGIAIIKEFEGFRGQAYLCPAGVWTIGYGHTSAAGAPAVVKGQMINRQRAEDILRSDVDRFENAIEGLIERAKVNVVLPHEFDAMVSLAFNIGVGAFSKSTVLKRYLRGDKAGAADAFLAWNKATVNGRKVVLAGLNRRRQAERSLFLGDRKVAEATAAIVEGTEMPRRVNKPVLREPMSKSGTGNTAVATGVAGAGVALEGVTQAVAFASQVKSTATEAASLIPGIPDGAALSIGLGLVIVIGAGVIWYRRWRRSREDELVDLGPEVVS
ncbi:MAG: hypothetical protein B7Z40_08675 [Bosea sp. 12-68-7]|nr:MAG: hypothetical protein B7Z40_08675 [Bosea sp. 12-68-7]